MDFEGSGIETRLPMMGYLRHICIADMNKPTSHSGIAQAWKAWSFGTPEFDSQCRRLFLSVVS